MLPPRVLAVGLLACAASLQAQPVDDARFAELVRQDNQFRKDQFVSEGLLSIDLVAGDGREVRRLWLRGAAPAELPVIEIERLGDGSIALALVQKGAVIGRGPAAAEEWAALVALDTGVFKPPVRQPPVAPPTSTACHGDSAYFEGASQRVVLSAGGMQCTGAAFPMTDAHRAAIRLMIGMALDALDCPRPADAYGLSLLSCSRAKQPA